MRNVGEEVSKQLAQDKKVIGVVLVGSLASGQVHGRSDIDLIVFCDAPQKQLPSYQLRKVEGFQAEMHYNSIEHLQHTFEDEQYRDEGTLYAPTFCQLAS